MDERLTRIANQEIEIHYNEADRLKDAAHHLLASAEWHLRQANKWQAYLGQIAIPEQGRPNLTIVNN